MVDKALRKEFYQVLDFAVGFEFAGARHPGYLTSDKYVPGLHADAGTDTIDALRGAIDFSAGEGAYLFSGMRGAGKTTELQRMQSQLHAAGDFFVLYTDARDHFSLVSRQEIGGFLLTLCAAVTEAIAAHPELGKNFADKGIWQRFVDTLLREVDLKELSAELSWNLSSEIGAKIAAKAALKQSTSLTDRLRERLRARAESLARLAEEFFSEVAGYIKKISGRPRVLLIVDSLEHIRGSSRKESQDVYESLATLFSSHTSELQPRSLSIVYSIPPYLAAISQGFAAFYAGGRIFPLAMVHVVNRTRDRSPNGEGVTLMLEVIRRRFGRWDEFFDEPGLRQLALKSGGDLRDFFRLIKACLTTSEQQMLPYPQSVLAYAEATLREDFRYLSNQDLDWLVKVTATNQIELPSIDHLPQLATLLDGKAMLNYRNGDDWYDAHPLLRERIERHASTASN